jgi:hypothetical protein
MSHFANKQSRVIWHFQSTVDDEYLWEMMPYLLEIPTNLPEKLAASICNVITDE